MWTYPEGSMWWYICAPVWSSMCLSIWQMSMTVATLAESFKPSVDQKFQTLIINPEYPRHQEGQDHRTSTEIKLQYFKSSNGTYFSNISASRSRGSQLLTATANLPKTWAFRNERGHVGLHSETYLIPDPTQNNGHAICRFDIMFCASCISTVNQWHDIQQNTKRKKLKWLAIFIHSPVLWIFPWNLHRMTSKRSCVNWKSSRRSWRKKVGLGGDGDLWDFWATGYSNWYVLYIIYINVRCR